MKSARGSKGSPAPGQAEQRKGEAVHPLGGGKEGAKEVPGALVSAQPGSARLRLGTQAEGRKPHQRHMHHRCLSWPHSPYPGAWSSAQQRREGEDRERDRRGAASKLSTLGTEPASPHWSKALGEDGFSWQRISPASKGRQGKASRAEPAPAHLGTGHMGNPSCPRAHKWHHQVGKQESPGQHREGERPLQSLSHVWGTLLVLEGRAMTGAGLGHSTSHPTPSPVHSGKGTSTNQNSLHP